MHVRWGAQISESSFYLIPIYLPVASLRRGCGPAVHGDATGGRGLTGQPHSQGQEQRGDTERRAREKAVRSGRGVRCGGRSR
eukprot:5528276-Prymnesium_polylepis.1